MNRHTLFFIFIIATPVAHAVSVSPIHLSVIPSIKSTSLNLTNDLDTPAVVDVRVKKWSSSDVLTGTDDVILSRPVVSVPAHSTVTVRAIVKARSSAPEDTYRILVQDITPSKSGSGLGVKIGFSLPLFVLNSKTSKGTLSLINEQIVNTGNRHVRISAYTENGKQVDVLRYLMPGDSITLPVTSVLDVVFSDDIY